MSYVAFEIRSTNERFGAAAEARRFAAQLGLSLSEQRRVALCVAELASNIARHASGGRIELWAVGDSVKPQRVLGCCVIAVDDGPGIDDLDSALRDGFSRARGLGVGLGSVIRLMTTSRFGTRDNGGLIVEAKLLRSAPIEP